MGSDISPGSQGACDAEHPSASWKTAIPRQEPELRRALSSYARQQQGPQRLPG